MDDLEIEVLALRTALKALSAWLYTITRVLHFCQDGHDPGSASMCSHKSCKRTKYLIEKYL